MSSVMDTHTVSVVSETAHTGPRVCISRLVLADNLHPRSLRTVASPHRIPLPLDAGALLCMIRCIRIAFAGANITGLSPTSTSSSGARCADMLTCASWHTLPAGTPVCHTYACARSFAKQMGGKGKSVEVDETFIGGASRFMHKSKRERLTGTGAVDKVAVMGLLERKRGAKHSPSTASISYRRQSLTIRVRAVRHPREHSGPDIGILWEVKNASGITLTVQNVDLRRCQAAPRWAQLD